MYNLVYLIGRLVSDPELKKSENSKEHVLVTIAVQRSFKNPDGIYDTDFIKCSLWNGIAKNVSEYCKKGDLIGIRGRIQTRDVEQPDESLRTITEVVAEKVTFLQSQKETK